MNEARRASPARSAAEHRRLSNTAGLAGAAGIGSMLWGGLAAGAHLLGVF